MKEIGEYLKNRRIELGISLDEAEQYLKIRKKYIIAIESGDESVLPGRTYFLGYLRNYANYLEADQDFINEHLEKKESIPKKVDINGEEKLKVKKASKYFSPDKRRYRIKKEKKSINFVPIIRIAIVILFIAGAFFLVSNFFNRVKQPPVEIEETEVTIKENSTTEEKTLEQELTEMAEKNLQQQQEELPQETQGIFLESLPEYKTINIATQEPVWVKVIQNDKLLFESIIFSNEDIKIKTEEEFSLFSTSSDSISVYLEEEEILPSYTDINRIWRYQILPSNENI